MVDESGMIKTQLGTHIGSEMVAVHGTPHYSNSILEKNSFSASQEPSAFYETSLFITVFTRAHLHSEPAKLGSYAHILSSSIHFNIIPKLRA
jgi:hypothetical protein